ncbi:MAG: hypothetical protein ACREA2_10475, partial [Blastocatellia bacterium]
MEKIIPSIQQGQQGPSVANFQSAMLCIIEKRQLSPGGASLAQWRRRLSREIATQTFGASTKKLFDALLSDMGIRAAKSVNQTLAKRLNSLLEELGAFAPPALVLSQSTEALVLSQSTEALVLSQSTEALVLSQSTENVFPLTLGAQGPMVAELHASL